MLSLRNKIIAILIITSSMFAAEYAIDFGKGKSEVQILENNDDNLIMRFTYSGIITESVDSKVGEFNKIVIPNTYTIGEIGTPEVPASKELIEIPFGATVTVNVSMYSISEYKLSDFNITNPIIPVQPSISKSTDPASVEFEYNANSYSIDTFSDHDLVTVEVLGVLRGMRLARLVVAPIRYNPVKRIIQVYNDIEVEIAFSGSDIAKTEYIRTSTYSPYFEVVYDAVINSRSRDYPNHPDLTTYPVKYLIVSDPMFENTLQPFIEWKTQKGFDVVVGYTDEIGSSVSQIQSWVHDQYNFVVPGGPIPSFVLFVGDTPQIPASATGSQTYKVTDLYYCSVDGDMFPEMYYGRFSATNISQLQAQIDKTLYYEKYEFNDPSFLDNVTLIAGEDYSHNPTHGQPTVLYGANNYYNASWDFVDINLYLTTYSGCYQTVNDGICFINYTAHGSQTSWSGPSLTQSGVNAFTNVGKYPLAIGNCCLAADFGYGECFGETWIRKVNGGAVGYIGSAPSSYWDEDVYWSVGAFPFVGNGVTPTYQETTWGEYDAAFVTDYVTQDAFVFIGNLAVTEADNQGYPGYAGPLYYWQAYNLLGDPSLVIYQTQGELNNVSHMAIIPLGVDFFEVSAEPGSYVGISFNGELHGAALVDESGIVSVTITPILQAGLADLVVTKPQYQPVVEQVPVAPLDGPYVTIDSFSVDANGDDVIEFGETVYLTVTLKNVGSDTASNVNMILSGNSNFIVLTDDYEDFGYIPDGELVTKVDAYTFVVSDSVPDNYGFDLSAVISATEDSWDDEISLIAYAPIISAGMVQVTNDDNSNGRLDAGETADIVVTLDNEGGATAHNVTANLSSLDPYLTINIDSDNLSSLGADTSGLVTFNVSVSDLTPTGHTIDFYVDITADNNYTASDSFTLSVGLCLEDFETGDFSRYPWDFAGYIIQWPNINPIEDFTIIDTIGVSWSITTDDVYEGVYSAKSGDITHNQASFMSVTADVLVDGAIEFYYRVACEYSPSGNYFYDGLIFYIDDVEMGRYQPTPSGGTPWTYVSYPVSSGSRTFSWAYVKDGSDGSTGMAEDCAWLDYIIFPPSEMISEDVSLTMTPLNPPVEIPAGGGTFDYNVMMVNNTDIAQTFYAVLFADIPNGSQYGPISPTPYLVQLPAGGTIDVDLTQNVPGNAPAGVYTYYCLVGTGYNSIIDSSGFTFTKLGTVQAGGIGEWISYYRDSNIAMRENDMWTVDGIYRENGTLIYGSMAADERLIPLSFALYQNYPNPFNPVTTIKYELPEKSYININIFNIRGEKVTELVSGVQMAGYHQVIWNGKNLNGKSVSSGIYIYSLSTDEFHSVKKMLLFK